MGIASEPNSSTTEKLLYTVAISAAPKTPPVGPEDRAARGPRLTTPPPMEMSSAKPD